MSLINQTVWVVGGVGVVGRGITRGLLQAGATVIVNSRSAQRLDTLQETLQYPKRLITIEESLLPGRASYTVNETLKNHSLHHVVAHGAVRWWARPTPGVYEFYEYKAGCDETYSLNIKSSEKLLEMPMEDFTISSAQLTSLHLSAAQNLIPKLEGKQPTYTFVTGDGSGKPGGSRTAMGEINSHHVWGLSAALRHELQQDESNLVNCREIRVGLPMESTKGLSEDLGYLCAGMACQSKEAGTLLNLDQKIQLQAALEGYPMNPDPELPDLPRFLCEAEAQEKLRLKNFKNR